jgi:hypothetical protein
MKLVAVLWIRTEALADFHEFECRASAIMREYGGSIERTVRIFTPDVPSRTKEVHIVGFPDADAFKLYQSDERLAALAPLRERAVIHTEIWVGEDGPSYAGAATGE